MTPQTLNNDLQKGVCDPQDLVLIVIGSCFIVAVSISYMSHR